MATATMSQSKTGFVKEFLNDHPDATARDVNEAWAAAGMKGTISHPVVSEVRKQLGLTGNLRGKSKKTRTAAEGKAAAIVPKTATTTPGKTSFVKEFLNDNPLGNVKDVNEAWQAAGFDGTISPTLVNKTRVKLTGKRRGYTRTAAEGKAAPNKPREATATLGKTSFVKEFLNDNPQGNVKAVNEAWTKAGMTGTISTTLVHKTRASLGLTGNLRGKSETSTKATTTGRRRGRPPKDTAVVFTVIPAGQPRGRKSDRTHALLGVEAEIDRLIFTVMRIGNLTEIETALREARRRVYRAIRS
jgi:hypothetical protein